MSEVPLYTPVNFGVGKKPGLTRDCSAQTDSARGRRGFIVCIWALKALKGARVLVAQSRCIRLRSDSCFPMDEGEWSVLNVEEWSAFHTCWPPTDMKSRTRALIPATFGILSKLETGDHHRGGPS